MGATEAHVAAYVAGVRSGGVIVFATAPGDKADAAVGIMNGHGATGIEEVSGEEAGLPGAEPSTQPSSPATSVLAGRSPSRTTGAQLFVW